MAKVKTYRYEGDGSVMIVVPGQGPIALEPGDTVTPTNDAEAAALEANPDLGPDTGTTKKTRG